MIFLSFKRRNNMTDCLPVSHETKNSSNGIVSKFLDLLSVFHKAETIVFLQDIEILGWHREGLV